MLQSPYTFKDNITFAPVGQRAQGISSKRLTTLVKQDIITERSEMLIQILYELQFLTGYLTQASFSHPVIHPSIRKFTNGKKNPYRFELDFLIRIGAIQPYAFFDGFNNIHSYVYGLTEGAYHWSEERFQGTGLFRKNRRAGEYLPYPTYGNILSILSLNQFLISAIVNNDEITDSFIDFGMGEPICKLKTSSSKIIMAGSIRLSNLSCHEISTYWKKVIDSAQDQPEAVIMVVESMEAARYLIMALDTFHMPIKPLFLFSCDYTSAYLKNPLQASLGRFTDDSVSTYELCSLHL